MTAETIEHAVPRTGRPTLGLAPQPAPFVPIDICRCGHESDAHEHFRAGSDCGVCGPAGCRRYRRRVGRGARSSFRG